MWLAYSSADSRTPACPVRKCASELSIFLKKRLQAAGRRDTFLYYSEGPSNQSLGVGLCPGLDHLGVAYYNSSIGQTVCNGDAHVCNGEAATVANFYNQGFEAELSVAVTVERPVVQTSAKALSTQKVD